jgi:molecular chaperone DnaK
LKENGDKLSGDNKGKIEKAIAEVKEALKGTDTAALKSATERLNEAWQGVSAELYKAAQEKRGPQAGGEPGAGPGPQAETEPGGKGKDDVIDAEVVDDKK